MQNCIYNMISLGNHKQNEKTTHRMEENICKWGYQQGLNFQDTKIAHTTQQQHKIKTETTEKQWKKDGQENLNRHLSKEKIQMVNRYMKRCSTLLNIREMQVKTRKNHHMPVRMAIIERFTNNKSWRECGEKGTFDTVGGVSWCSH